MPINQNQAGTFYGLGIAPQLLDILQKQRFTVPTPIQQKAIPVALEGKDLIGIAQTGTGKTLAFAVPMLQRLAGVKGRGLILLPTRELALQVDEVLVKIGRLLGLYTAVLIGGASMNNQIAALRRNPHIIVATPGRLIDHLDQRTISLDNVRILILDEADRMLDMGFAPQIKKILNRVPRDRQTMLFSATMPPAISSLAAEYLRLPLRVEVAPAGTAAERVDHELFIVEKNDKPRLLEKVLEQYRGTVLVFSRTKHGARKLTRSVKAKGTNAAEIHANRTLNQRKEALQGFKTGRYRVLIATDIAARGIDVTGIELVVNYDLPDRAEDYVHRIGRTGRAGRPGKAISFATPDQQKDVRDIERLVRFELRRAPLPGGLPPPRPEVKFEPRPPRPEERKKFYEPPRGPRGRHGRRRPPRKFYYV
ncbi:DEAD/DEAH box helicase [Patescibacteria group bacterium]|nr:MAG: DEAD/DEAH box helicase [Patescibacteria group bacterium]